MKNCFQPAALAQDVCARGLARPVKLAGLAWAVSPGGLARAGGLASAPVAALCVSGRSIYHHLPGVLAYDRKRDARSYGGGVPVVAHPPCRTWSKFLRHQAKPADWQAEQDLGRFCVQMVVENGGVLEHPAGSLLWADRQLPLPGDHADRFLYTIYLEQSWFGYASRKPTWLLVAGVPANSLPSVPFNLAAGELARPGLCQAGRSRTVGCFSEWLCGVARLSWWSLRFPGFGGAK